VAHEKQFVSAGEVGPAMLELAERIKAILPGIPLGTVVKEHYQELECSSAVMPQQMQDRPAECTRGQAVEMSSFPKAKKRFDF
jgi:hypothetical protein